MKETLQQNGYPECFLSPQCSPSRKDREEKDDPISRVTIPYIQGISEAVTRILSDINVQVHMKSFRTLRRILSQPKDHIPDDDKSSIVYKINCCDCDASYVGEMGKGTQGPCVRAPQGNGEEGLLCFCSSAACMGAQPSHRLD